MPAMSGQTGFDASLASPGKSREGTPMKARTEKSQVKELLLEVLETELGGVQVYTTALKCVVREDLKEEWEEYLAQTQQHVQVARDLCDKLGVDVNEITPGRLIVKHIGESLVTAMTMALEAGDKNAAQLVAAECVTSAETKDHSNWELVGALGKKMTGPEGKALREAREEVEEEEDEHLYHTKGWARELWIESLGLPAVLPPPEEEKDVKTAIGAERAKKARDDMI
jgi:hypothetical protein